MRGRVKKHDSDSRGVSTAKEVVNVLGANAPDTQSQVLAEPWDERQADECGRGPAAEAAQSGWAVTPEQEALLTAHAAALRILELMCEP
jgi:hypothetical protein